LCSDGFVEYFEQFDIDWQWKNPAEFRSRFLIKGLTESIVKAFGG